MPADQFAANSVTELLNRSRALQHATAVLTIEARAAFDRLLEARAAVRAQIAALGPATVCPTPA